MASRVQIPEVIFVAVGLFEIKMQAFGTVAYESRCTVKVRMVKKYGEMKMILYILK